MKVAGIHDRQGYVEIHLEGAFSTGELPKMAEAIQHAGQRKDGARILANALEVTTPTLTTLERYQLAMCAGGLPPASRLAFVAQLHLLDPERFGESVARNRGHDVKVFTDEAVARTWLLDPNTPPVSPEGT